MKFINVKISWNLSWAYTGKAQIHLFEKPMADYTDYNNEEDVPCSWISYYKHLDVPGETGKNNVFTEDICWGVSTRVECERQTAIAQRAACATDAPRSGAKSGAIDFPADARLYQHRRSSMYLEDILGSKTKVRVLYHMFMAEQDSFFEKELAHKCGSSVSEVNRQIHFLVEFGLILFQKQGRLKMYRLNQAHFLYKPLKELFVASTT